MPGQENVDNTIPEWLYQIGRAEMEEMQQRHRNSALWQSEKAEQIRQLEASIRIREEEYLRLPTVPPLLPESVYPRGSETWQLREELRETVSRWVISDAKLLLSYCRLSLETYLVR